MVEGVKAVVWGWNRWNQVVEERRRMQSSVPDQFGEGEGRLWGDRASRRAFVNDLQRQYG